MKLRLAQGAAAEVEEILAAIQAKSSVAAAQLSARFDSAFTLIVDFPFAGRATTQHDIRCIGTRPFPYLIFYRVREAEKLVEVAAVRHGARSPASMPARLPR